MLQKYCISLGLYFYLLQYSALANGELFTAMTDIEKLLETHSLVVSDLQSYIDKEDQRLSTLKRHLELFKKEQQAMKAIPDYLDNPINAFILIKRLTTDLGYIKYSILKGSEHIKELMKKYENVVYPSQEDLTGAVDAIMRLQKTYELDVTDLANGIIKNATRGSPMIAGDCYALGLAFYNKDDFLNTRKWMVEALRKYVKEKYLYPFTEVNIIEYITLACHRTNDARCAEVGIENIKAKKPGQFLTQDDAAKYLEVMAVQDSAQQKRTMETGHAKKNFKGGNTFEALCRGEFVIPVEISSRLNCRYLTESHPFLKIAPMKVEILYRNPDLILFHDVLSDSEIERVKDLATPQLTRALVHEPKDGKLVTADYRVSKTAWLYMDRSDVVARIARRTIQMTRLSLKTAEPLHVINYGIGGHYTPHYDFARMSDVEQGGATIFPNIGVSVPPVKGTALFWYNLHPSGEGDTATRHGACPVLQGSKWVCNIWFHQVGQELIRPCNLEYQEEGAINITRPVPKVAR